MESVAVTKPDMGVLSRQKMVLSPFGVLAQAFSEELLARAGFEEGRYPFVPLDFLEEEVPGLPPAVVQPMLQVNLSLVLEALRREERKTERERATERIVERIIRKWGPIHSTDRPAAVRAARRTPRQQFPRAERPDAGQTVPASEQMPAQRGASVMERERREDDIRVSEHTPAQRSVSAGERKEDEDGAAASERLSVRRSALAGERRGREDGVAVSEHPTERPFALRQEFYNTIHQHLRFITNIRVFPVGSSRQSIPGGLGRRSVDFSRRFQQLREQGRPAEAGVAVSQDGTRPAIFEIFNDLTALFPYGAAAPGEGAETGARILAQEDLRRLSPEELAHLEQGGAASAYTIPPAREIAGTLRGGAEQLVRRLEQELASEMSRAWRRKTGGEGQDQAEAARQRTGPESRPISRVQFENTTSEGPERKVVLHDGADTVQAAGAAERAESEAERVRRETGDRRSSAGRWRPEAGEPVRGGQAPARAARPREALSAGETSADTAEMPDSGAERPRQTIVAPYSREDRRLPSAARDIRLTAGETGGYAFSAAETPPEPAALPGAEPAALPGAELAVLPGAELAALPGAELAALPSAELAHRTRPEPMPAADGTGHMAGPNETAGRRMEPMTRDGAAARSGGERRTGTGRAGTPPSRAVRSAPEPGAPPVQAVSGTQNIPFTRKPPRQTADGRRMDILSGEATGKPAWTDRREHVPSEEGGISREDSVYLKLLGQKMAEALPLGRARGFDRRFPEPNGIRETAGPRLAPSVRDIRVYGDGSLAAEAGAAGPPAILTAGTELAYYLSPPDRERTARLSGGPADAGGGRGIYAAAQADTEIQQRSQTATDIPQRLQAAADTPQRPQTGTDTSQRPRPMTARDIRFFRASKAASSGKADGAERETIAAAGPAAGSFQVPAVHRVREADPRTAAFGQSHRGTAGPWRSGISGAVRSAMVSRNAAAPEVHTWFKERLSGRVRPAAQGVRDWQGDYVLSAKRETLSRTAADKAPAAPAMDPVELAYSGGEQTQGGRERTGGQSAVFDRKAVLPPDAALRTGGGTEPPELAYSSQRQARDDPGAAARGRLQGREESGSIRGLPDWARRFLQEGAPTSVTEAARQMSVSRDMRPAKSIAAPAAFGRGETFEWTAPDYRAPAPIEYRETPRREEQNDVQNLRISDAEIRRTAERVYQMIEDRIRRERRRIGL